MSRIREYERTIGIPMDQEMIDALKNESQRLGGMSMSAIVRSMVKSALTASAGVERHLPWEARDVL